MMEPAQVSGFSQDGHCRDRTDTRYLPQSLVVGVISKTSVRLLLDCIALADQAAPSARASWDIAIAALSMLTGRAIDA